MADTATATPTAQAIRDAVGSYFDHVRAGDVNAIAQLFADDAVIDYRDGVVTGGPEQLRVHFGRTVTSDRPPTVEITKWIIDSPWCATEITARYDRGERQRHAVDVFTFDEQCHIAHLTVYWR